MAKESGASARVVLAVALVGLSGAWNGGNVGPVASELGAEFDLSLAVVGILAGTLFLGSVIVGLLFAAQIGERTGVARGLKLACAITFAGNLLFAIAPDFVGLAAGRVLVGLSFALANTLGAVWARDMGGVRLLGIFGGAIQLGIAGALLVGSGLADAGVDWRVGFFISAALGAAAFVAIPGRDEAAEAPERHGTGFLKSALGHARVYRLATLFVSIYGVPMILSAWLIEYLSRDGSVAVGVAGVIAFLLFGLSAVVRVLGASLQERGVPHRLLGGGLLLAAIGLAALTFEPVTAVAFAAVILLAFGFGIPYATALGEAQDLYPEAPGEPVALMTFAALIPPVIAIPIVGHAISRGGGDIALGILTAFVLLATVLNIKPTGIPLSEPEPEPEPQAEG